MFSFFAAVLVPDAVWSLLGYEEQPAAAQGGDGLDLESGAVPSSARGRGTPHPAAMAVASRPPQTPPQPYPAQKTAQKTAQMNAQMNAQMTLSQRLPRPHPGPEPVPEPVPNAAADAEAATTAVFFSSPSGLRSW